MFTLTVVNRFKAHHFLVGGDWGDENKLHFHEYKLEIHFEGNELDQHGFLIDIVEVEQTLKELVRYFEDATLNELPEFKNLNPSIEQFSKIFCHKLANHLDTSYIKALTARLWENEYACASYRLTL
jgi:6-pyruvoyltetrahydropterin/6-carboxytetrahydropterin synthase